MKSEIPAFEFLKELYPEKRDSLPQPNSRTSSFQEWGPDVEHIAQASQEEEPAGQLNFDPVNSG